MKKYLEKIDDLLNEIKILPQCAAVASCPTKFSSHERRVQIIKIIQLLLNINQLHSKVRTSYIPMYLEILWIIFPAGLFPVCVLEHSFSQLQRCLYPLKYKVHLLRVGLISMI